MKINPEKENIFGDDFEELDSSNTEQVEFRLSLWGAKGLRKSGTEKPKQNNKDTTQPIG